LRNDSWHYPADEWVTIVGVVGDVRHRGPLSAPVPEVYVYYRQRSFRADDAVLVVGADGPLRQVGDAVQRRIREMDANIPVDIDSLDRLRRAAVAEQRFAIVVLGSFALIAVLLAAIGIHGVVAQAVQQRTREMGIRLALGASPARVLAPALRGTVLAVALGSGAGALLAVSLDRVLRGMLFDVTAVDAPTLLAVAALVSIAAGFAALGPALRAVRLDPTTSLRAE